MDGFPQRLRQLREARRLHQDAVAQLCGFGDHMIGRYERGEVEPAAGRVVILADFFHVSTDYLLGRSDVPDWRP